MYFGFRIPLKTFVLPFLPTRLTAPGSPRMTKRIQIPNRLQTWKMPGRFSNDRVLEVKQQILHVYHAFWYISMPWPRRAVPKDSTAVKFTYICRFEQVGINSEKFGTTRIRFNWDLFPTLAINIFKAPYNVTLSFWFKTLNTGSISIYWTALLISLYFSILYWLVFFLVDQRKFFFSDGSMMLSSFWTTWPCCILTWWVEATF